MISCSDAVRQLWDYLDGAVGPEDRRAIEEHLDVCRRCCGEVEFANELRSFLVTYGNEEISPAVRTRLTTFLEGI